MRRIAEGAEAYIYSVNVFGIEGILKLRESKKYRIREIDENLRMQRTKKEARIMNAVGLLGISSPTLLLVDRYGIVMTKIDGKNLNDVGKYHADIFSILGTYAALLHNNNIIHGDFTPANVMVDGSGMPVLIDFGLSDITNSAEEKALDILLMKRSINDNEFKKFVESYTKSCKESRTILKRLVEIEKRGRYNTRTLAIN
jgi:Kae1-associated kinase Bud32